MTAVVDCDFLSTNYGTAGLAMTENEKQSTYTAASSVGVFTGLSVRISLKRVALPRNARM